MDPIATTEKQDAAFHHCNIAIFKKKQDSVANLLLKLREKLRQTSDDMWNIYYVIIIIANNITSSL